MVFRCGKHHPGGAGDLLLQLLGLLGDGLGARRRKVESGRFNLEFPGRTLPWITTMRIPSDEWVTFAPCVTR